MNFFDRIEELRKAHNLSQGKLEELLGFSNGSINKWKTSVPKADRLQKIADYFGVTIDYLMTGSTKEWEPTITEKDEKDIKKKLDDLINQLSTDTGLMYDGEPMDEESLDAVRAALEVAERTAMLEARRKFTPNKYKK